MQFPEEQLQEIFKFADKNGDGKIDINEITLDNFTTRDLPRLTRTDFHNILNQHDSDKDGSITYDELKAAVEKVEAS
ncbi:EF-hand domain-containing protein [Nostoc parmelioides]|uniref:EF-hand domain-containing protein n=1 Tax=Nostoc parmelioides FACHB-3921 TaxID=2692909 RepID=A0ABR8BHA1_9NOSO|nr:EF-hand domain-containing protein [Nostoc parmelioides]MBD2252885.1 EF-hand domain-containing protein [Nostoc parmelioides FACHB-3921]